jgi:hypothetical protein
MRFALATLVALLALIHLLGAARASGWTAGHPLHPAIAGAPWLVTALLLLLAAAGVGLRARWWWYPALPAVVLSQALTISAWSDAKLVTLPNLFIAIPLLLDALDTRRSSFSSRFARGRDALLARTTLAASLVTEADLVPLPPLLRTYLRRLGVVGRPRVRNLRVTFVARMRSSATAPWMRATATQVEGFDPPARLFHMRATRAGIPLDVLHEYVDGAATFRVRLAGLVPVVNKEGPGITHDETVTLMNDVLVLAPAAVLDLPFSFETTGVRTVRATFRNAGFTVSATLTFDAAGDLVGFRSADRAHDREAGAASWSTPISGYRVVDGIRVGARGDTNWVEPTGEWTYGHFEVVSLAHNVDH